MIAARTIVLVTIFACSRTHSTPPSAAQTPESPNDGRFLGPKGDGTCWRVENQDDTAGIAAPCPDRSTIDSLPLKRLSRIACDAYIACIGQPIEGCSVEPEESHMGVSFTQSCARKIAVATTCASVRTLSRDGCAPESLNTSHRDLAGLQMTQPAHRSHCARAVADSSSPIRNPISGGRAYLHKRLPLPARAALTHAHRRAPARQSTHTRLR
jgi:hypothetical protein